MTDANYADKKKMLFDSLISAEECIKGTSLEQKPVEEHQSTTHLSNDNKAVVRRFHGRESIFKRPAAPISKCLKPRQSPDYKINPHKWKKYSLEDSDISDRSNTSAAFQFLAEIEQNKQNASDADDEAMGSSNPIVFNRKTKFTHLAALRKDTESSSDDNQCDKAVLKGSKVVMPEYVIGQKPKSKNKKATQSVTSKRSNETSDSAKAALQLQHLMEEDDDED